MSWLLAFVGFASLIILHEIGHFAVAKWVGMRVERFALFFPPLLLKRKIGETEYAVGAVPLGGYVKITGMSREEEVDPKHSDRTYIGSAPWKRIAVIAAGPLMNFLIAFVILFSMYFFLGVTKQTNKVTEVSKGSAAAGVIRPGDKVLAVDGKTGPTEELRKLIAARSCKPPVVDGCKASRPTEILLERGKKQQTVEVTTTYSSADKRMLLGVLFGFTQTDVGFGGSLKNSISDEWQVTKATVALPFRVFDSEKRKEIGTAANAYEATRQAVQIDLRYALVLLAIISISLAAINLFPILPLDGGHILFAAIEGITGKKIPTIAVQRASFVGFALVMMLFFVGLNNDIARIANGTLGQP